MFDPGQPPVGDNVDAAKLAVPLVAALAARAEISVPSIEYPDGYQVGVTGGHVVSAANAPVLVIASNGDADTVNITVTHAP